MNTPGLDTPKRSIPEPSRSCSASTGEVKKKVEATTQDLSDGEDSSYEHVKAEEPKGGTGGVGSPIVTAYESVQQSPISFISKGLESVKRRFL